MDVKYIVHRQKREKTQYVPAHYHSYYELIYYFRGTGVTHYYSGSESRKPSRLTYIPSFFKYKQQFSFKDRTCILYRADTIHDECYDSDSEVFSIVFEADKNECALDNLSIYDASGIIETNITHIEKEFAQKKIGYSPMIDALLLQTIVLLERNYHAQKNEEEDLWAQTFHFIEDYFTTNIDFEMLAQSTGYSLGHFRALFKQRTGVSPKTYIIRKRMELAKGLVENTAIPMQDIAQQIGYQDYFQFSAYFKKFFGMSPAKYRKSPSD